MRKKQSPKTLADAMADIHRQMLSDPMITVQLELVILRTEKSEEIVAAAIDFGDGENAAFQDEFLKDASHLITPGQFLYRKTVSISASELLSRPNEAKSKL